MSQTLFYKGEPVVLERGGGSLFFFFPFLLLLFPLDTVMMEAESSYLADIIVEYFQTFWDWQTY